MEDNQLRLDKRIKLPPIMRLDKNGNYVVGTFSNFSMACQVVIKWNGDPTVYIRYQDTDGIKLYWIEKILPFELLGLIGADGWFDENTHLLHGDKIVSRTFLENTSKIEKAAYFKGITLPLELHVFSSGSGWKLKNTKEKYAEYYPSLQEIATAMEKKCKELNCEAVLVVEKGIVYDWNKTYQTTTESNSKKLDFADALVALQNEDEGIAEDLNKLFECVSQLIYEIIRRHTNIKRFKYTDGSSYLGSAEWHIYAMTLFRKLEDMFSMKNLFTSDVPSDLLYKEK